MRHLQTTSARVQSQTYARWSTPMTPLSLHTGRSWVNCYLSDWTFLRMTKLLNSRGIGSSANHLKGLNRRPAMLDFRSHLLPMPSLPEAGAIAEPVCINTTSPSTFGFSANCKSIKRRTQTRPSLLGSVLLKALAKQPFARSCNIY